MYGDLFGKKSILKKEAGMGKLLGEMGSLEGNRGKGELQSREKGNGGRLSPNWFFFDFGFEWPS